MVAAADSQVVDVLWTMIILLCWVASGSMLILGFGERVPARCARLGRGGVGRHGDRPRRGERRAAQLQVPRDRPRRMTGHSGPGRAGGEPDPSPRASGAGPGVVLGTNAGVPVVTLAGRVDHELVEQADAMLQHLTLEHDGPIAIDVSGVDAITGALLGLLLRSNRRLAWRNRQLIIACSHSEHSRRLRIAGLDELATLVEPGDAFSPSRRVGAGRKEGGRDATRGLWLDR